jgi:hypothetical protein
MYPFTLKQDSAAHDHDETDAALIVVALPETTDSPFKRNTLHSFDRLRTDVVR